MENVDIILTKLPYGGEFLFVDELLHISETSVSGNFTFREKAFFYPHHFPDNPVTPGVILIECMAQIGLACLGIFLTKNKTPAVSGFALSSSEVDFLKPVYPNETVTVHAEKIYFRFGKLKVRARMSDLAGNVICRGTLSGMALKGVTQKSRKL
jgi:3-hydroxyacyl-[acyl-carrier-protein] dehydratase